MRTIEYANAFRRDFRRTKAVPRYANNLDELLASVLDRLVRDLPLPETNRDHGLVRMGTHSELFD